jgi:hypothetical protein
MYDIIRKMALYSDSAVRHHTQYDILQWSECTTSWHSTVILLYDIIHSMAFCSDWNVRRYTQNDILQWSECTALYAKWHSTVILLYDIIHNETFSSDPTVRQYTQRDILQWSYCTKKTVRNYHYSLRNNPEESISHLLRGGSLKPRTLQSLSLTQIGYKSDWRIRERCLITRLFCIGVLDVTRLLWPL